MIFTILGGGFGLYGYLPALIRCGHTVMLPERYRATLEQRSELKSFLKSVQWRASEDVIRDAADAMVISRRPADQTNWLRQFAATARATTIILEKPLGASPASALELLDLLAGTGKTYRVAYTFRFLPWARDLAAAVASNTPDPIDIVWKFRAHHYLHEKYTWKRRVSEGGGALRFFGIHLIGLLAELGYREVRESQCAASAPDECEKWSARFSSPGLRDCRILVDSNSSETAFRIGSTAGTSQIFGQGSPFPGAPRPDGLDNRVEVLESLCKSLSTETVPAPSWYAPSIALWEQAELVSQRDYSPRT